MDHAAVQRWLDNYVTAWKSYDPQAIGDLFSEDAVCLYGPFDKPVNGRAAIVASWLKHRDPQGTYDAHYQPIVVEGNNAVSNGRSTYFEADGKTVERVYDNIFVLRFDDNGQCTSFSEWFIKKR
jgi:uncharacterized protein (TIGR02246 family)